MTFKVAKSQMPEGFEASVAKHAHEMKIWREHMQRVANDKKNGVTGDKMHVAYHRPDAHPLVKESVNENDVADYQIVDDSPTPDQILAAKKELLIGKISMAEAVATRAVTPAGRARAWSIREGDILKSQTPSTSVLGTVKNAIGLSKKLSADDEQFLADQDTRRQKADAIARAAAQMMSDVEDLTVANIDAWKMPDFPK